MFDIELDTGTAGAYVYCGGYFVFAFGFGSNHPQHALGVVRLGGHREKGESVIQCVAREVKEEASLDISFFDNKLMYAGEKDCIGHQKFVKDHGTNPILVLRGKEGSLSVMYMAYGHGTITPRMETQGILFLRKEDIRMICTRDTTFAEYKQSGGKHLLARELPDSAVLSPHVQVRFLHDLFTLEGELMARYMK